MRSRLFCHAHAFTFLLAASLCVATPNLHGQSSVFEGDAKPKKVVDEGAGEGPAWSPERGLFCSGPRGILLLNRNGVSQLFMEAAGSNGLLFDHQGRLLICQPKYRRVSRFNFASGKTEILTEGYHGKRYNSPNDITVDSKGRIYFSDPKYGERDSMEMLDESGKKVEGVYRIDLDGSVTRIVAHQVDRPNGVLVTPDDRYLFVADNYNNQVDAARKLWRFDLDEQGNVNFPSKRLIYDWKSGRGPDGMAIDQNGTLFVAGGRNEANLPFETSEAFKGGVYVLSGEGKLLDFVPIPRDEVTNCAFGGDDLKTLYITAGGTLWTIRTRVAGRPVWPNR